MVVVAGIVLMNLPAAMLVTLLALPFWKWLDVSAGFESYGHSGPAEWCYWTVFALLNLSVFAFWVCKRRTSVSPINK